MKKILYLSCYEMTIPITGAALRGREIIRFLSQSYEIHLICLAGAGYVTKKNDSEQTQIHANALKRVATTQIIPFNRVRFHLFSGKLFFAAVRLMRKIEFDIIIADYGLTALYGYLLAKKFKVPWIYSSHNIEHLRYLDFVKEEPLRYPFVLWQYLAERLGCTADVLIAISVDDQNVFRKWMPDEKILMIPQGFNENEFYSRVPVTAAKSSKSTPIILFFGNFKNPGNRQVPYLVFEKMIDPVVQQIPNALFRFVGANPPNELKHPRAEFLGFVDDLKKTIYESHVVIAPIVGGGGMKTKIIEALACGKIVISSPKGIQGIHDSFKNLIVAELVEFSDNICSVLKGNNPEAYYEKNDFIRLKQRYSWNSILPKLKDRIETLIQIK